MRKLLRFLRTRAQGILFVFVPLADVSQSQKLSALYNNSQDLSGYLNSIFKIAISAGAILAVLRLGYAGYLYMGSDLWGNKEKAKEIMQNVFLGLFLLLSVYIILAQINPNILNLKVNITPITPFTTAMSGATGNQAKLDAILQDETRMRTLLATTNTNITLNAAQCTSLSQTSGCTNVGLLPDFVVNRLDSLQKACSAATGAICNIVISGGTEFWMHTSHGPGIPTLDLRKDANLISYINTLYPNQHNGGTYTVQLGAVGGGNFYSEDSAHYHVAFF